MVISLIKAMRPKQWAKNAALYAGLIFDRKLGYFPIFLKATYGVILFSFLASAIYLINDLSDVEADKLHPTKKHRQIWLQVALCLRGAKSRGGASPRR